MLYILALFDIINMKKYFIKLIVIIIQSKEHCHSVYMVPFTGNRILKLNFIFEILKNN